MNPETALLHRPPLGRTVETVHQPVAAWRRNPAVPMGIATSVTENGKSPGAARKVLSGSKMSRFWNAQRSAPAAR